MVYVLPETTFQLLAFVCALSCSLMQPDDRLYLPSQAGDGCVFVFLRFHRLDKSVHLSKSVCWGGQWPLNLFTLLLSIQEVMSPSQWIY